MYETLQKIKEIMNRLPLKDLKTDDFGGGKTQELFDAPEWKELSQTFCQL